MLRACLWRMLYPHPCKGSQTVINVMGLDDSTGGPSSSHMICLTLQQTYCKVCLTQLACKWTVLCERDHYYTEKVLHKQNWCCVFINGVQFNLLFALKFRMLEATFILRGEYVLYVL